MTTCPLAATVVIPCHNKMATLPEVLNALRAQDFPRHDFEVVVVDDGSTDGSAELVPSLGDGLPRIALEQMGTHAEICPARVRNRGLDKARGNVVVFLDADILVGPSFIREHVEAHAAGSGETAVIGYIYAYPLLARERTPEVLRPPPVGDVLRELPELLRKDPKRWRDGREVNYRIWPDLTACPLTWFFFWSGNVSVSRAKALELGGFDEEFKNWGFEDLEFGYRLWKAHVAFTLRRAAWGFHYPHSTGTDQRLSDNNRQFLRKHPEPYAELSCFSMRYQGTSAAKVRWEILELIATPPLAEAPSDDVFRRLLAFARAQFGERPVAWFGELPEASSFCAELTSRPFRASADETCSALIGLTLPHADKEFGAAVLFDYWLALSSAALRFVVAEIMRIADVCVLASFARSDARLDDDALREYVVETSDCGGARIHVFRRDRAS